MKVIHLSKSDIKGGAFIAAYRTHCALRNDNMNSIMWVDIKKSNDESVQGFDNSIFNKLLINVKFHIHRIILKFFKRDNTKISSLAIFPSFLLNKINVSNADIINLHWINREMLSIEDIGKITKPLIWTIHDMWPFIGAEHITLSKRWSKGYSIHHYSKKNFGLDLDLWTWKRKKKNWKKPIQIITPSSWLKNYVKESQLMSNWPVKVIPNPIDINQWKPMNQKTARNKLRLNENAKLILFGALGYESDTNKGFDLYQKALVFLKKITKLSNIQLVFLGQNNPNSNFALGFPSHYLGRIYDEEILRCIYCAADLTAVPSRIESFCQMASESQSCGTPIIAFNTSGLIDVVDHRKTGYLAKKYDEYDFAKGINWILNHKDPYSLRENARAKVVKEFSYEVVSKKYQQVYEEILKINY